MGPRARRLGTALALRIVTNQEKRHARTITSGNRPKEGSSPRSTPLFRVTFFGWSCWCSSASINSYFTSARAPDFQGQSRRLAAFVTGVATPISGPVTRRNASPHHAVPENVLERNRETVIGGSTRRPSPRSSDAEPKPRWSPCGVFRHHVVAKIAKSGVRLRW